MRKLRARRLLSRSKQPATQPRRAPSVRRTYPVREGETGAQNSLESQPLPLPLPTATSPRHPHTFRFENGLYKYATGALRTSASIKRSFDVGFASFKVYSQSALSTPEYTSVRGLISEDDGQRPATSLSSTLMQLYQRAAKVYTIADSIHAVFFQLFRDRGNLKALRLPWTTIEPGSRQWNMYCQLHRVRPRAPISVPQICIAMLECLTLPEMRHLRWSTVNSRVQIEIIANLRTSVMKDRGQDEYSNQAPPESSSSRGFIQKIVDDLLCAIAPVAAESTSTNMAGVVQKMTDAITTYLRSSILPGLLDFQTLEVVIRDERRQRYVSSVLLNSDGSQRGVGTEEPVTQQSAIILGGGGSVDGVALSGPTREKIGADTANANVDTAPGASIESCSMSVTEYIQEFDNICRTSHETGLKCCLVAANRLAQSNEDSSGTLHINCNPSETKDLPHGASISIEWNKTLGQTYLLLRIPVSSVEVRMVTSDAVDLQVSNITLRYALPEIEDDQLGASEAKRETAMDEVSTINQALNSVCENVVEKAEFASLDEIPVRLAEAVLEVLHLPHFGITLKKVHVSVRRVNDSRALYRGEASRPSRQTIPDQLYGRHVVIEHPTSSSVEPQGGLSDEYPTDKPSHISPDSWGTRDGLRKHNKHEVFFEHAWKGLKTLNRLTGFDSFQLQMIWPNSASPTSVETLHFKSIVDQDLEVGHQGDITWLQTVLDKLSHFDSPPTHMRVQISTDRLRSIPALSGIPLSSFNKPQLVLQVIKYPLRSIGDDSNTDTRVTFLPPSIIVPIELAESAHSDGTKAAVSFKLVGVFTQRKLSDSRRMAEYLADLGRSVYDTTSAILHDECCETLQDVANRLTDSLFERRRDLSTRFEVRGVEIKVSLRGDNLSGAPIETVFGSRQIGLDGVDAEDEHGPITSRTQTNSHKFTSHERSEEGLVSNGSVDLHTHSAVRPWEHAQSPLALGPSKQNPGTFITTFTRSEALMQSTGFKFYDVHVAKHSSAHAHLPDIKAHELKNLIESSLPAGARGGVSCLEDLLSTLDDLGSSAWYLELIRRATRNSTHHGLQLSGIAPDFRIQCFKIQADGCVTTQGFRYIRIMFPTFMSSIKLEDPVLKANTQAHFSLAVEGAFTNRASHQSTTAFEAISQVFKDMYGIIAGLLHRQDFPNLDTMLNRVIDALYHKREVLDTVLDVRVLKIGASLREGTFQARAIAKAVATRKVDKTATSEYQTEAIDDKDFSSLGMLVESDVNDEHSLDSKSRETTLSILDPIIETATKGTDNAATPKLHAAGWKASEHSEEEGTAQGLVEHRATLELPWRTAFIALGSNLGDRFKNIEDACREMDADPGIRIVKTSHLYETEPMYVADQGSFLNGACQVETTLQPLDLLDKLQGVENRLGRIKMVEKGPRSIDLDILIYEGVIMATERLTIPHALMHEREFVLKPLMDLRRARQWSISKGLAVKTALGRLSKTLTYELMPLGPASQYLRASDPKKVTRVMSVLNTTPDSFSDGGDNPVSDIEALQAIVRSQIEAGSSIVDIGGQSSRPNAPDVTAEEEIGRILPAIEAIRSIPEAKHVAISVDTYRAPVAEAAINAGANIINDISAGILDPDMFRTIAKLGCTYVMMHMRGTPATMMNPENCRYEEGLIETIHVELRRRIHEAQTAGIRRWRIVLDPGIGFSKTAEQNAELLRQFGRLRSRFPGYSWLVGTSRKSFIGKLTGVEDPKQRVWGTAATVTAAVMGGADIVRVHDVKEMADVVKMADAMYRV